MAAHRIAGFHERQFAGRHRVPDAPRLEHLRELVEQVRAWSIWASPVWRYLAMAAVGLLAALALAVFAVAAAGGAAPAPGVVPGAGVTPMPRPGPYGGFATVPSTKYPAPVVPGPQGARRAPLVATASPAARVGEPGHLERLVDPTRPGVWPLEQRAAALEGAHRGC